MLFFIIFYEKFCPFLFFHILYFTATHFLSIHLLYVYFSSIAKKFAFPDKDSKSESYSSKCIFILLA